MTWVAVAVAGAAVIGGVASNQASKKTADAAKKGIKSSNALAGQSRQDAINLFGQGRDSAQLGIGGALDFYQDTAQQRNQPLIQGNMMAQQAMGQGGIQANNAILGLPVDMSFANTPQQVTADYSKINAAKIPQLGINYGDYQTPIDEAAAAADLAQHQANRKKGDAEKNSVKYRLNLKNQFKNQENDFKKVFGGLF
jgi:hypothetical protein